GDRRILRSAREMNRAAWVLLSLMIAGSAQAGGDAAKGKQKAAQVCAACHGPDGNKPSAPDQPVLSGQYADYLERALSDYKNGRRDSRGLGSWRRSPRGQSARRGTPDR